MLRPYSGPYRSRLSGFREAGFRQVGDFQFERGLSLLVDQVSQHSVHHCFELSVPMVNRHHVDFMQVVEKLDAVVMVLDTLRIFGKGIPHLYYLVE